MISHPISCFRTPRLQAIAALLPLLLGAGALSAATTAPARSYPIVDTGVTEFYSDNARISRPAPGAPFHGQDAHYRINPPSYRANGDGTVTDLITGLTWQQQMGTKVSFNQANIQASQLRLGGHSDWRLPTIKELYSLIQFTGRMQHQRPVTPYIDVRYFPQPQGDSAAGERAIDAQNWSATEYVSRTMGRAPSVFGVNFIDGRIKGYPKYDPRSGQPKRMYVRYVRGNPDYGKNLLVDNGDGTISDHATGLMWQKSDSGRGMAWADALDYAQRATTAGYHDWRLPSAKELHSIVDYSRSPKSSSSAAIDPLFHTSQISAPDNRLQFPYFWSSTTHLDGRNPYSSAVYIAFGEALGRMGGQHQRPPGQGQGARPGFGMPPPERRGSDGPPPPRRRAEHPQQATGALMDVHGAGAQRSDPKSGSRSSYPQYIGPQGDLRWVFNHVRAVRSITP